MTQDTSIAIGEALVEQAVALGDALRARGWRLATAESCTGGLLAGTCTAPAGASDWFAAGFVTYANDAKSGLLGVPEALIQAHGAVSSEVADAMARGALAHAGVQLALSVTGIAGPSGGTPDKPIGTVFIGLASFAGTQVQSNFNPYDRETFKQVTAQQALDRLRRTLKSSSRKSQPA